jgi:hypothetical protein
MGKASIARRRLIPRTLAARKHKPSRLDKILSGAPHVIVPRNADEASSLVTHVYLEAHMLLLNLQVFASAFDGAMAGIKECDVPSDDVGDYCKFLREYLDGLSTDVHRIEARLYEAGRALAHNRKNA